MPRTRTAYHTKIGGTLVPRRATYKAKGRTIMQNRATRMRARGVGASGIRRMRVRTRARRKARY